MRWSDGPRAEREIIINAAPSRIWPIVSDIELPAKYSAELRRVEWLDGATGPAVGARFAGYNNNESLGDWRSVAEIVELVPERRFTWAVISAATRLGELIGSAAEPVATWRFTLEPTDQGTRVIHDTTFGPARSAMNIAFERRPEREEQIIDTRIADMTVAMWTTLEGVKDLVES